MPRTFSLPFDAITALHNHLIREDLDRSTLPYITNTLLANHQLAGLLRYYAGAVTIECNSPEDLSRLRDNLENFMFAYQDLVAHEKIPQNQAHEQALSDLRTQVNQAIQQLAAAAAAPAATTSTTSTSSTVAAGLGKFGIHTTPKADTTSIKSAPSSSSARVQAA